MLLNLNYLLLVHPSVSFGSFFWVLISDVLFLFHPHRLCVGVCVCVFVPFLIRLFQIWNTVVVVLVSDGCFWVFGEGLRVLFCGVI